jgi:acyl-CoA synthetase (AMP-forming)/AMP-acid ligase II
MTGTVLHDLLDRAARRRPGAIAVSRGPAAMTYRELHGRSIAIAGRLRRRGIRRGDRILVAAADDLLVVPLLYACSRVGAAFTVTHRELTGRRLAVLAADCAPALAVHGPDVTGLADVPRAALAEFDTDGAPAPSPAGRSGPLAVDPAALIYTSGSTGGSRAVVGTHAQMTFATQAIAARLRYRPGDVVYCALPLSFDYGLYQIFLAARAGAHLRLGAAGPRLVADLRRCGATVLPAMPHLAEMLGRLLTRDPDLPALRLLTSTGATMPPAVPATLRRLLPGLRVQLMYGLTECKRAAIMPVDGDLTHPGACGRVLPGTEMFAADADGNPLPSGTLGELVVRGPHVMAGYWRRPAETAHRFRRREDLTVQLHTGDRGIVDAEGYVHFDGRDADLYKQRGFRISTGEIEAAAHGLAGVRSAVVLPPGGARAEAVLVVAGEAAPAEVLRGLRDELEPYKLPPHCIALDALPLTANGKVDRDALDRMVCDVGVA